MRVISFSIYTPLELKPTKDRPVWLILEMNGQRGVVPGFWNGKEFRNLYNGIIFEPVLEWYYDNNELILT